MTHQFKNAQSDIDGKSTKSFEFAPSILVGGSMAMPFFSTIFFTPALGYVIYKEGKDGYKKNEIILQYHFTRPLVPNWALRFGLSNYITSIQGKGGSTQLNNGSGTSTFYTPSTKKKSYTASLDFAGEFIFAQKYSLRPQLSFERFLSNDRRTLAHLITLNYFF